MKEITLTAYAKLNLYLDITGRRDDGYHMLKTVMQSVSLADYVKIALNEGGGISVSCSDPLIPANEGNICHKAARLFFEEIGGGSADIRIEKRIPSGAGMGGGSTDAAAVLKGLNILYGNPVDDRRLSEIAAKVGADVPFCLCGGTKFCRGIGDIISEVPPIKECAFLIVMPDFACPTAEAYRRYDENPLTARKNFNEFIKSDGEYWRHLYNVFEDLYGDRRITELTDKLRSAGALGAALTGSGSAVFGIFDAAEKAAVAARAFPTLFTSVCTAVRNEDILHNAEEYV